MGSQQRDTVVEQVWGLLAALWRQPGGEREGHGEASRRQIAAGTKVGMAQTEGSEQIRTWFEVAFPESADR